MLTKTIIAAGALLSMAAAVPLQQQNKRDVKWETSTMWDVTTIDVTTTIWLAPGETAPAGAGPAPGPHPGPAKHGHHHKHKVTSHIKSTVTVQPASPSAPPAQSSVYVAPSPSSPAAQTTTWSSPPAETTTPATSPSPKPSPSSKPQPSSGPGNYPGDGLTGAAAAGTKYTGDFTWYDTGLGACGETSQPSDHIVAISEDLFDQYATANPNDNPVCGKTVTLTGVDGTLYPATVVDRCTGCAMSDLDLSEDFFNLVTSNGNGRVSGMHWVWD